MKIFSFLFGLFLFLCTTQFCVPAEINMEPSAKIDAVLAQSMDAQRPSLLHTDAKNTAKGMLKTRTSIAGLDENLMADVWITLSDASLPRNVLIELGVEIRTDLGTILTAWVPITRIKQIADIPQIAYLECSKILTPSLDKSVPETHADLVWKETVPGNRGAGVIIGIIDSGIDYLHGDFVLRMTNQEFWQFGIK